MKRPGRRRADIDEEIRSHLRLAIADRIARGESPDEAERHARIELGNELLVRERTRDVWPGAGVQRWLQDLRYAVRQIRRQPGVSAVAVLTLALGLGSVTAAAAVINSVLVEPLRFREPDRLFSVVNRPPPGTEHRYWLTNGRHVHEWRTHCRSCEDIAMAENVAFNLSQAGGAERFEGLRVSFTFFRTLGVQPALGRDFRPEEELPADSRVLILSDATWRGYFAADPGVIGRTLRVNGEPYVVIGVMPSDLRLPLGDQWGPRFGSVATQPAMFRPLGQDFSQARPAGNNNYASVVRLRPGVTAAQAEAELNALIAEFVRQFDIQPRPMLLPLHDTVVRDARAGLLLLGAIALTTLLIVCVNVGHLMLIRTASRDREVGIRMALGSSRGQLFGLVLTEALVLVAIGAVASLGVAYAGLEAFRLWAPPELPRVADLHAGPRVWMITLASAAAATVVCGLLPAWRMARTDPQDALKAATRTQSSARRTVRIRELMVGVEVALSTVLLVVGGLLTLSLVRVLAVPMGVDVAHVITQDVSTSIAGYDGASRIRFAEQALERLAGIPGVAAAGVTNQVPLRGETWICQLRDGAMPDGPAAALANFRFVSGGYFDATGIPITRGRTFRAADRGQPVALISERTAQALWPGQDAVGRRVGGCGDSSLEVLGVVGDARADLEKDAPVVVYEPYWTMPISRPHFVVRTRVEPERVAADVRAALHDLNPEFPIGQAATLADIVDRAVTGRRFQMRVVLGFAALALVLASLGIYGVVSFAVATRVPEIGIRLALGARRSALGLMVVRQGLLPVAFGLAAGLVVGVAAGRAASSQLFGVAPGDPWILAGVSLLLFIVGAAACWLPARRAMRVNPLRALRAE